MACHILSLTKEFGYNHKIFTRAISLLDAFLSTSTVSHSVSNVRDLMTRYNHVTYVYTHAALAVCVCT